MENEDPDKKPKASDKMMDKAADTLTWWNKAASINADDKIWAVVLKVLIRIVGIVLLLILSPFVILGIMLAFMAAS